MLYTFEYKLEPLHSNMDIWLLLFIAITVSYRVISDCPTEWCLSYYRDCQEYQACGHSASHVYQVVPVGMVTGYNVSCDMITDGGGWLIFQRRLDGSLDFYNNWDAYEFGFGDVSHEYWLSLLPLKRILLQGHYELRIDLEDWEGERRYAKYQLFNIGGSKDDYTLTIGGYSGNAGDSMREHNNRMFSTKDRDNDIDGLNCAETYKGAWWYAKCHRANLNGLYLTGNTTSYADGVNWYSWKGFFYSIKMTEMKIRRA